jgi:hypothetical protein
MTEIDEVIKKMKNVARSLSIEPIKMGQFFEKLEKTFC